MSEEKKERGFLGEVCIFLFFVALVLGAVYLTGNWDNMMNILKGLMGDAKNLGGMAKDSVDTMKNVWGG